MDKPEPAATPQAVEERLQQSRDAIRVMLLGESATPDGFPRSKIMRAALNPQYRSLVMTAAALATLFFPGVRRLGRVSGLAIKMGQAGSALLRSRR